MVKYTKEMNAFIFFMCHAFKNNIEMGGSTILKTFGPPIPFIRIDNSGKES